LKQEALPGFGMSEVLQKKANSSLAFVVSKSFFDQNEVNKFYGQALMRQRISHPNILQLINFVQNRPSPSSAISYKLLFEYINSNLSQDISVHET